MTIPVNVDNFVRMETARMFHDIQAEAGGVNTFRHNRTPAPIENQTVIRLNRDTLYSFAVVDAAGGASVTVPEADGRYVSVMLVDEDHYVVDVLHEPGEHPVVAPPGTRHLLVAARVLVDPSEAEDVAAVGAIQDRLVLAASASEPYRPPDYDPETLDRTRTALLTLAAGLRTFERTFGARQDVDPVRHLIGTAAGWGGLPSAEATYVGIDPQVPPGTYRLTMADVPVDAFWSVSVYDATGYFVKNDADRYTVNSVTGARNADGSVSVHFVAPYGSAGLPNSIPTPGPGWNFLVRLYRPRPEVLDGTWTVPALEPVQG